VFKPFELLVTELAQPAGLQIQHVNQPNEVNAVLVKAVPTRTFAFDILQVPLTVHLPSIIEHVMLPRDVEDVLSSAALKNLVKRVELFGFRQLCDISGVNKERRWSRHRVDAVESNFECLGNILIRRFVKPDMAIADLQKAQISSRR